MRVTTWNVNGIRARSAEVQQWIQREAPDVVCLQEIKAGPASIPETVAQLPGYWTLWHGFKGYSGVALHLRREVFPNRPRFFHPEFDHETRIVMAQAGRVAFASIYVPNGGKDFDAKLRFLEAMDALTAQAKARGELLVLCGDLNVALEERDVHPTLRKADQIGQTPHERALLGRVISHGLVDVGRRLAPDDDRLYTWWAPWRNLRQRNIGWRLDYVLASEEIAARAVSCASRRDFGTSDHGPVDAVFDWTPPPYEAAPEPPADAPPVAPEGQLKLI